MNVIEPTVEKLDKLHSDFLFSIPDYFLNNTEDEFTKLDKLFFPIINNDYFSASLRWFVIWEKKLNIEDTCLYFLKGKNDYACNVVEIVTTQVYRLKVEGY